MLGFRVRTRRAARAFGGREWSGGGGARGEFGFGSEGERERCWGCGIGKGRRVYANGGIRNRICALPACLRLAACGLRGGRGGAGGARGVARVAGLLLCYCYVHTAAATSPVGNLGPLCVLFLVCTVCTSAGVRVNGCLVGLVDDLRALILI